MGFVVQLGGPPADLAGGLFEGGDRALAAAGRADEQVAVDQHRFGVAPLRLGAGEIGLQVGPPDFAAVGGYRTAQWFSGTDGPSGTDIETSGYFYESTGTQGYKTGGAVSGAYALFDWACTGGYCDANQYNLNPSGWAGNTCQCTSSSDAYRWGYQY